MRRYHHPRVGTAPAHTVPATEAITAELVRCSAGGRPQRPELEIGPHALAFIDAEERLLHLSTWAQQLFFVNLLADKDAKA